MLGLAFKSLRNRRFTAGLTILSIALSVALLMGVERIRQESQRSFASTISGTDLIVGARSGPVHLLLSSVFRIGSPTNTISWDSYEAIAGLPATAWAVPISLGDSHNSFPVVGTSVEHFEHFRYARERRLTLAEGRLFGSPYEAVIGAEVARALGYRSGQSIVLSHGAGNVAFHRHDEAPFHVTGLLRPTGTPVDRTVYVSLAGFDAIHAGMRQGAARYDPLSSSRKARPDRGAADHSEHGDHGNDGEAAAEAITAILVGLKARAAALQVQRFVNEYEGEPLAAILPGATLLELWSITRVAERALLTIAAFVVAVGLIGMLTTLLTNLEERRREMAILRSVGAGPIHVMGLAAGEAVFLTVAGTVLGVGLLYVLLLLGAPVLQAEFGLFVGIGWPSGPELGILGLVLGLGCVVGLLPAYRVYRFTLADGMTVRL